MDRKNRIPHFDTTGNFMNLNQEEIVSDPMGSYTGIPVDAEEKPVQDADDL